MQQDFLDNPSGAVAPFELTRHERDALVTRDCDDLRALGITNLPSVLGCPPPSGGPRRSDFTGGLKDRLEKLLGRGPKKPDLDFPQQPPGPDPGG